MSHNYRSFEDFKNSSSYNGESFEDYVNSSRSSYNVECLPEANQNSLLYNSTIEKLEAQKEKRRIRQRERRANLSEEQHAIVKTRAAELKRNKLTELKASSDPTKYEQHLEKHREYCRKSIQLRTPEIHKTILANKRDNERKRYTEMKTAEIQIRDAIILENEDVNIEELQTLASKRRKVIDATIQNRRQNKRSKWVQVLQVWDEEHPCQ